MTPGLTGSTRGMSGQQPNRSRGPPSPLFRPASPWAPSPPPLISGGRHSSALVSPGPGHRPLSRGSPLPAPRPTWPHPQGPSPFRRLHSPSPSISISPYPSPIMMCQSPEYLYSSPYDGDCVGVPLEPPRPLHYEEDEEQRGPSTAEIIANQSQDYVDEKLAEYQQTILLLQGESNSLLL